MKQVFVDRNGAIQVEEVPAPVCGENGVLIEVGHCLISAGTEMSAVRSFLRKAAERPEARRQVFESLRTAGIGETARKIRDRLATLTPLGYQGAGRVAAKGAKVSDLEAGDLVAYAGSNHAERVYAPRNLVVKLPAGLTTREGAFVALGAIAMHGVRRAGTAMGERAVVIGLGLVGQLAAQLLEVAGARVIALDLSEERLALARKLTRALCLNPGRCDAVKAVMDATGGHGADAVIVAASSRSSDIIRQAARMARDRSRVNVVGWIGMDLDQHPYYLKELDIVFSRSYGPGRYDERYEQEGQDYPIGYVRWTENRNMAEFLELGAEGRVKLQELVTDEFPLAEAGAAYGKIAAAGTATMGVLLRGAAEAPAAAEASAAAGTKAAETTLGLRSGSPRAGAVRFGVAGLGWFATNMHLPNLRRMGEAEVAAVADIRGETAMQVGKRYGARRCTTAFAELLAMEEVDAVVITTRHHQHAEMAIEALRAGKHVFVEKPLALSVEDGERVRAAVRESGRLLTVGFNRRFAPLTEAVRANLKSLTGPMVLQLTINAGWMDPGSWYLDPEIGGGRIHGEVCHFFDLVCYLTGSEPEFIEGMMLGSTSRNIPAKDNVALGVRFADGSLAEIVYTSLGHKGHPKERVEVYGGGTVQVIENFQRLRCHGCGGSRKLRAVDKGHLAHMRAFIRAVGGEGAEFPTVDDGIRAIRMATAAEEALATRAAAAV